MRVRWVPILAVLIFSACVLTEHGAKKPQSAKAPLMKTAEMEKAFQSAEHLYYARRLTEARETFLGYIKQFSYNLLTAKAYFRLGEIAFHEKDFKSAVAFYKKSIDRAIDSEWGNYAIYKLAVADTKLEDYKKSLSALDLLPSDGGDSKVGIRAGALRLSSAKKLSDPLEEIKGYLELIDAYQTLQPQLNETQVGELSWVASEKQARDEVRHWIDGGNEKEDADLPVNRLKGWMRRFEGKESGGLVTWKIALYFHQKGDYAESGRWLQAYLQGYAKQEFAPEARRLLAEVEKRGEIPKVVGGGGGRTSIGVLLPLSGKFSIYGESVLHGIECAAGIFSPCKGDAGGHLVIRDTQGDSKTAARLTQELAQNGDVRAIIGPMAQVEVDEAAAVSEKEATPMIALSQKADVAKAGRYIFRNFLTPADQVATLVGYACREKHWKRLAILYPQGPGGEEYLKAFQDEVKDCGGKIVAKASYPPETRIFTQAVRELKMSGSQRTVEGGVDFQALFIPDVYRRVPEVIVALKFHQIEGVHLLGGAGWNHPDLIKKGGTDVEGAIFVDAFYPKGSNFATRDFVATFQAAYGVEPTLLEAYAYDTMKMLGDILKEHPGADRVNLQKLLEDERGFPGVTGSISFDEDGDARRKLFVLTVQDGQIQEVR